MAALLLLLLGICTRRLRARLSRHKHRKDALVVRTSLGVDGAGALALAQIEVCGSPLSPPLMAGSTRSLFDLAESLPLDDFAEFPTLDDLASLVGHRGGCVLEPPPPSCRGDASGGGGGRASPGDIDLRQPAPRICMYAYTL